VFQALVHPIKAYVKRGTLYLNKDSYAVSAIFRKHKNFTETLVLCPPEGTRSASEAQIKQRTREIKNTRLNSLR